MKARLALAVALGIAAIPAIARADTPGVSWALYDQDHYQRRSAAVWDVDREVVVLFGGSGNHYDADTSELALHATTLEVGALWRTRHDSTQQPGPRRRMSHAMAYDTSNKRTILYGGDTRFGGDGGAPLTVQLLADTWTWNGTTWTKSCDACGPGPLAGHAMVFDEARGKTVLFGGMPTRYPESVTAATWEHDGTSWAALCGVPGKPACGPTPRAYAGMAYDVARKKTVLFGGRGTKQSDVFGYGVSYDDTWEWDGQSWVARCGVTAGLGSCGLGARYEHGMAYHRTRKRTSVLFGVHDEDPDGAAGPAVPVGIIHQDVWEWDGSTWSTICGTPAKGTCGNLAGRAGAVATYRTLPTPERRYIGLFGGHNLLPSNLVHYWDDATYAVSGSCKSDGDCDVGTCVDNICCQTASCHQCQRCEATSGPLGACVSVKNADHASCSGTCDEASVCRKKQGASACTKNEDCASNACVDGVCCDRPCESTCEACSVARGAERDGTCAPVGAGKAGRASCGAYVCNGRESRCPTGCSATTDCVAPHTCIETGPGVRACVLPEPCDGDILRRSDGTLLDCAPYACAAAGCKTNCATVTDCSAGTVCRGDHTCGPLPTESDDAGGCRVAAPGLGSGVRVGVGFAIVMSLWAACRRRKSRRA